MAQLVLKMVVLLLLWNGKIMAFLISLKSWNHGKWITPFRLYMGPS